MNIQRLDHIVLTVSDIERTCTFYVSALGMEVVRSAQGRVSLHFGQQKINLHLRGHEFEPKASHPAPGSADLCFITESTVEEVLAHLESTGVPTIEGPVRRTGALGPMESVYVRDPDGNLVEVSKYL